MGYYGYEFFTSIWYFTTQWVDIAFLRWKQKEERVGVCFMLFFTSMLLGLESMHGYLILGLACVCMRSPVGVFCLGGGENIVG
jgi:hypothetical protein